MARTSGFHFNRILPSAIGAAVGLPIGTQLLVTLTSEQMKFGIGVFLILFATTRLFLLSRYTIPLAGWRAGGLAGWRAKLADGGLGTIGGIVCGTTALPGPIFSMWCGMRGWSKDEQRCVYQPLNYAVVVMSVVSFASAGLVNERVLTVSTWAAPSVIVGILIGTPLYHKMNDATFGKVILVMLAAMGGILIATN
ncbi:MAG: sulfite exporter TauE/SafE family protein [Hyphomicrobiaceae bacterium]